MIQNGRATGDPRRRAAQSGNIEDVTFIGRLTTSSIQATHAMAWSLAPFLVWAVATVGLLLQRISPSSAYLGRLSTERVGRGAAR